MSDGIATLKGVSDGEAWMTVFYAMVCGDICRYYLGDWSFVVYLVVGLTGIILRGRTKCTRT